MAAITDIPARDQPLVNPEFTATEWMFAWMTFVNELLRDGETVVIATAKLTGGGANGSMTFQNGILVSQTPAT